ncbi:MAG: phage portal protein, partial [Pseudomonadota bacterium]|nr:phage portal protein [Pseudomonadota bacterium]
MNRFLQWLAPPRPTTPAAVPERKAYPLVAFQALGEASWSFAGDGALAREGFARNPIVYRCVRMVAEAAASLPLVLREDGAELAAHPVLDLLARPAAQNDGRQFLERLYGHLLVAGNAYVHAVTLDGTPRELHLLRPDRVDTATDPAGWPVAYVYSAGSTRTRFAAEGDPPPVCHIAVFNPLDDVTGLPPLGPAHMALDIHNAASRWNKALLDNSARPSGALTYAAAEGGNLTDEQFERLKAELEEGYAGATRAGRPMLLEGGLDWKAMGY